jgi:hypothetical protein
MVGIITSSSPRQSIDVKMRNLVQNNKPTMEVTLKTPEGRREEYVTSYSTLDRIEGTVTITPPHDTKFDSFEITFEGKYGTLPDPRCSGKLTNLQEWRRHLWTSLPRRRP